MKNLLVLLLALMVTFSCSVEKNKKVDSTLLLEELSEQLKVLVRITPDDKVPRYFPEVGGGYSMIGIRDWTCGFPAGSYWFMYEMTGDEFWEKAAIENTIKLDGVQHRTNTHDLGFMVFCSFGNGYRLTGNKNYRDIIVEASESLITRFNPKIGAIKSWDWGEWEFKFPVIIDNMMNLEMLFWASKVTGDPKYRMVAVSHADKTLKYHFRGDWSSYHVLNYDTLTGEPTEKKTGQGYSDESAWGRGQAWGLYGYTMCYRETGFKRYLEAAENIAGYILENLPEDKISFWDFNDPAIPDTERDASAAAISASALFELSTFSEKGEKYLDAASKIVENLTSDEYRTKDGSNGGFLLKHSVGSKPQNSEVDVAMNYTDYYYLEALKRQQTLKNIKKYGGNL